MKIIEKEWGEKWIKSLAQEAGKESKISFNYREQKGKMKVSKMKLSNMDERYRNKGRITGRY